MELSCEHGSWRFLGFLETAEPLKAPDMGGPINRREADIHTHAATFYCTVCLMLEARAMQSPEEGGIDNSIAMK